MSRTVSRLVTSTVAVAIVLFAAATFLSPPRDTIAAATCSVPLGLAFWTALTLVASALPVRLPRGTVASVSVAPILATIALGGPVAAAIVGFVGGFVTLVARMTSRDIDDGPDSGAIV